MKKYLILSLLTVSQFVLADCNLKSASILENTHKVGPIQNLVKSSKPGHCGVSYTIDVDGENHFVAYGVEGTEKEETLCSYAVERGRRELLMNLGGQFKTEANLVCQEGRAPKATIKTGDIIMENEVQMNTRLNFYWPYKNFAKCRIFDERYVRNKVPVEYHGVICQKNDNDWLVVDKW